MRVLIILFIACYMLYKLGGVRWLISQFRLEAAAAVQSPSNDTTKSWYELEQEERKELEEEAELALKAKGHTRPGIVRCMSNRELINLVWEYRRSPISYPRQKKEMIAANILCARGAKFDVWGTVKILSDNELIEIIHEGY